MLLCAALINKSTTMKSSITIMEKVPALPTPHSIPILTHTHTHNLNAYTLLLIQTKHLRHFLSILPLPSHSLAHSLAARLTCSCIPQFEPKRGLTIEE